MVRAVPEFSRRRVDTAGATLIQPAASRQELNAALVVTNNWRASHGFVLNTFQTNLRKKVAHVDEGALVVQRLKRRSSIEAKLRRFPWLKLSKMQDIGGCRVVVGTIDQVFQVVEQFKGSRIKHRLSDEDNYVIQPKESGYRSLHLVYRYFSDRKPTYNDMRVEIQFRSRLQHAWATAVETVDTFSRQFLKADAGDPEWARLFALMGSEIALTERCEEVVPNTPNRRRELRREIAERAGDLDAVNRLRGYGIALNALEDFGAQEARVNQGGKGYYLLVLKQLDGGSWSIAVTEFEQAEVGDAARAYEEAEEANRREPGAEAVLVNVDSLGALRQAYPNYFADTRVFVAELTRAIRRGGHSRVK